LVALALSPSFNLRSFRSFSKISGQFPQKINSRLQLRPTPTPTPNTANAIIPSFYYLLFISWYEQIKEAAVEEAAEAEINAPAAVEEVEAAVAVEEIVPPRNLIKVRPVDLDDVTLEEAAGVIKDVEVVDAEEGEEDGEEEGVVVVEVDGERMKSRNQPPQRN
jgi:hypothetical protein